MNDPMRILKADHREVEQLLKRLAETDEGRERNALADEVAMKLTAHMDIEESIVYPPVSTEVGADDREEAEIEHRLARQGLETMVSMVEQPGFGAAVQMLMGGIAHHVEEEESQLLPELKDAMERDEWLAMGDAIAAAKKAAGLTVPEGVRRRSTKRHTRSGGSSRATKSSTSGTRKASANKTTTSKTSGARQSAAPSSKRSSAKPTTAKPTTSSRRTPKASSKR